MNEQFLGLANKKIIIILVGLVSVIALVGLTLYIMNLNKPKIESVGSVLKETNTQTSQNESTPAVIILSSANPQIKVGQSFSISINISSRTSSDGTDIVLLYDPNLVSVESTAEKAVTVGSIYPEYPINVDDKKGKIMVSGISSTPEGSLASGLFGTVSFKALKTGKANINVDFIKGSTIDSNVIETQSSSDILEAVQNVEVLIN